MPGTPFIVAIQVEQPAGTIRPDIEVTLRQNATNEPKSLNTNAQGQVQFQLAKTSDFPSGYTLGDTITAFVIYQGYEGSIDHKIVAADGGGWSTTLVLTDLPSAPSLHLFTPQEFLDALNMPLSEDDAENGVPIQQMVKIGEGAEKEIEGDCNTVFDNNSGDYYTQTDYFDDVAHHRVFTPRKRPIKAITSLNYNTARSGVADSWNATSLTENTEYTRSPDTDKIRMSDNNTLNPQGNRPRGWRLIYTYGRDSVPGDIKLLAIYDTAIKMGYTAVVSAKIGGKDITSEDFERFYWMNYRNRIITRYKKHTNVST